MNILRKIYDKWLKYMIKMISKSKSKQNIFHFLSNPEKVGVSKIQNEKPTTIKYVFKVK